MLAPLFVMTTRKSLAGTPEEQVLMRRTRDGLQTFFGDYDKMTGGNPDRANYTKNVIQTGARNRFELEDKAGNEWMRLSTPYATSLRPHDAAMAEVASF